ncbi:MAG TPA: POTRA domain-containing protein, partial [Bacteroidales bacterium]|nr:POTRA domain-containing protein [Bacteroidales bacterium]
MKKNISNKNTCPPGSMLLVFALFLLFSACHPTRYVPQDASLLDKNHVSVNREGINRGTLEPFIKQKPNKRIFGMRFHLGLYNLSNVKKEGWPHSWLRKIGEEPVIYDPYLTGKSVEQIRSYVASKGYFDARVTDTVRTEKQKSEVFYNVALKSPYRIRSLHYERISKFIVQTA